MSSVPAAGSTVFRWTSASATTAGKVREVNEDSSLDMPAAGLWVVADGMGGHNAGDVASRMIAEALSGVRPRDRPSQFVDDVEDRLLAVNAELFGRSAEGGLSGSTVAALLAFGRYTLCLWAGDSRIYRCRGTQLEQVTRDHSEVEENRDLGTGGGAANVITRAVGGAAELHLDVELRTLRDGDHYLLCSDGLFKELSDAQIAQVLAREEPRAACKRLIEYAMAGQCADNVTVVAVQFRQGSRGPGGPGS